MAPSCHITHVGTATALIDIDGVIFLTDPYFSPAGTSWNGQAIVLTHDHDPALKLEDMPPIDAILLSHEDHPDNLDVLGRRLLDGRKVLTTVDGAKKLAPRPGVVGLSPWQEVELIAGGKKFRVVGTPTQHLPGGECTGFIITSEYFGTTGNKPNALYFSGDTVWIDELARLKDHYHIQVALLNLGGAAVEMPDQPPLVITMDAHQAAHMVREIGADLMVPMHFDSWHHFKQHEGDLRQQLEEEGIMDKTKFLIPGEKTKIY
jgi:L-ascorbate metabolism protein UlaG (beta-lactamase superfamily)